MGFGMGGGRGYGRMMRGDTPQKPMNMRASFKRVYAYVLPYWRVLLLGFICLAIVTTLSALQPLLVRWMVNDILRDRHFEYVPTLLWAMGGLALGRAVFGFTRTYVLHVTGQRIVHGLRVTLYAHFQRLSLGYYDNTRTGDTMSRLSGDVAEVENLTVHGLDVILRDILAAVFALIILLTVSPTITLIALVALPVMAVMSAVFLRIVREAYRRVRDRVGDLNVELQENISGIRIVKAFSREDTELAHVSQRSAGVMDAQVRAFRIWPFFSSITGLLESGGGILVTGVMLYLFAGDRLTMGDIIMVPMYLGMLQQPVGSINQFFNTIQRALAAAERIFEVLDAEPEIKDPAEPVDLPRLEGRVEFRDLSFRYATGEMVLKGINVTAEPGQRIALVGRSGAGKSSFINLIPRFYDALEGQVLVDGVDVRAVRQEDLRRQIALVLQETFLFNGTIRENIRYGKLDATDAEIEAAARAANAHEFIARLEHGYDSEIGERGVKLSGGQRQRLSIARAILADPRILILDEATSSVDSESEFLIHQALDRLISGRTTFIIAHRLSTIRTADTILVLENGEIVERGRHADLLMLDGHYARMYRQQFWVDDLITDEEEVEAEGEALPRVEVEEA